MNQSIERNNNSNQRLFQAFVSRRQNALGQAANWLVFLILVLLFLLLKDVVFKSVEVPRTSIERDVMSYGDRLRRNPQDPVARAGLGIAYMKMGNFAAAASQFATAVKVKPKNSQYLYNLGVAYKELKRYDDALEVLGKAVRLSPRWDAPRYELGNVFLARKEYDKAISAFEKSLGQVDGNANAYFNLANAYELKGDRDKALASYRKALKYVPDYSEAAAAVTRLRSR